MNNISSLQDLTISANVLVDFVTSVVREERTEERLERSGEPRL